MEFNAAHGSVSKDVWLARVQGMRLDNLSGRSEKRLPIAVPVQLEGLEPEGAEEHRHEKTHTDNVSAHGVRVQSERPWHQGEQAEITPLNQELPVRGEVVYCEKLDDKHFFVGLKLPDGKIPWPILERFNGI